MKKIIKLLEKPRVIVPAFFVIALIVGAVGYNYIGQTPRIVIPNDSSSATSSVESAGNSIGLAFLKSGRLSRISVTVGSQVRKGDVLASIDAGDALGAVNQTKGALELAKAQYASLSVQYANTKKQQDVLVANAYRTLLSNNLMAVAEKLDNNQSGVTVDNSQLLQITGTYNCDKEGSYEVFPYPSGAQSGYSFTFKGLEEGTGNATYYTPQPLGSCGLFVQLPVGYSSGNNVKWVINIPNMKSSGYAANKNAYDLAVANRDQVLKQLEANLGQDTSANANIAQAAVDSAEGAYEVAMAAYQNSFIVSPVDGVITFVDSNLKVGQLVTANKTIITVIKK